MGLRTGLRLGELIGLRWDDVDHRTMEMTMRYSHLSQDVRRDAVKLLDTNGNIAATRPTWARNRTES